MIDYRIKYPLPDLVNKAWVVRKLQHLVSLAVWCEQKKSDQPGFAVDWKTHPHPAPPCMIEKLELDPIIYLPFTPTISEFQLYLRDRKVRPYVRWIADQDALESVSHYIYGTKYPQYKSKWQGWEHRFVERYVTL